MYQTKSLQWGLCLLLAVLSLPLFGSNSPERLNNTAIAGVNLDEFPKNWQLYPRNKTTNKANVPISGTVSDFSGYDQIRVKLYKNNVLDNTVQANLNYQGSTANFNFSIPINAELSNYRFALIGVNNGAETVEITAEKVVAGDVYAINGQSNAEAAAAANPADENEFLRSYTYNFGWNYINFSFPGLWGAHLGAKIITEENIPVAIFNDAVGAQQIDFYLRNDSNPTAGNYGSQKKRMEDAGVNDNVRAFIWFQGEADAWNVPIDEYKVDMAKLYNAWMSDYDLDAVYLYQVRYQSCNSPKPLILEAHRQSANELPDLHIMSTTNAIHDGCHFPYEGGYKTLASRLYNLVKRDVYNINSSNITPPDVNGITVSNNTITIQMTGSSSLSLTGNPWADFELEGGIATVTGGSLSGNTITLNLSGEAAGVTAVSYLGHPGGADDWIFNSKDIGILTFYEYPITNPVPGNGLGEINCNDINISSSNGSIVVSGLDAAPITRLQIFNSSWSVAFDCLNNCNATETVNLPEGTYYVYVKYFNEDWAPECQINETINLTNSGGGGVVDNDNDGVAAADDCDDNDPNIPTTPGNTCNDGNSNTTNDIIQSDGCTCAGTATGGGSGPGPIDCANLVISSNGTTLSIAGLGTSPVSKLQVFTSSWSLVHSCFGDCDDTEILNLTEGTYRVTASLHNSSWVEICKITEEIELQEGGTGVIDNDNDGVAAGADCDDNDASIPTNPGIACNDNNSNTNNDVIQSDGCTCAGIDAGGGGGSTGADLELTMTAQESEYIIYEHINYTLTLSNNGNEDAQNVVVTNKLPTGAVYSSHVASNGSDYSPWNGNWQVGNVSAGQTIVLELKLFVLADNQPINNFAQVSSATGDDPDSTPDNNTSNNPSEDDEASVVLPAGVRSNNTVGIQLSQNRLIVLANLYPNPTSDNLNLQIMANESSTQKLQVFDAYGAMRQVDNVTLEDGLNTIHLDVNELAAGMYFLLFESENGHEPIRFVKGRL